MKSIYSSCSYHFAAIQIMAWREEFISICRFTFDSFGPHRFVLTFKPLGLLLSFFSLE